MRLSHMWSLVKTGYVVVEKERSFASSSLVVAMSSREERIGLNEAVFREVNERIEDLAETFDLKTPPSTSSASAATPPASSASAMTRTEYEELRSESHQFAVHPGHEYPDVESVVARLKGYDVVRKNRGVPKQIAEQTDPRGRLTNASSSQHSATRSRKARPATTHAAAVTRRASGSTGRRRSNRGSCSATAVSTGERTDEIMARLDDCARGADMLVVQGGINDIAQGRSVEDAARHPARDGSARQGARAARRHHRRAALEQRLAGRGAADPAAERADRRARAGRERSAAPVPRHARGSRAPGRMRDDWTSDGDHPSVEGYRKLGEVVARLAGLYLDVVHVAVGGAFDAVGQGKLVGAMDDDEPAGAGLLERGDRFLRRQVTA